MGITQPQTKEGALGTVFSNLSRQSLVNYVIEPSFGGGCVILISDYCAQSEEMKRIPYQKIRIQNDSIFLYFSPSRDAVFWVNCSMFTEMYVDMFITKKDCFIPFKLDFWLFWLFLALYGWRCMIWVGASHLIFWPFSKPKLRLPNGSPFLKPLSFTNNSVQIGSTAADHEGKNSSYRVARFDLDSARFKWNGLERNCLINTAEETQPAVQNEHRVI